MGNFLESLQTLDLLDGLYHGGEPAVDSKDGAIDADSNGEVVENVGVVLPDHSVAILGLALHVKPIVLGDGTSLVVPSDHCHFLRVFYLEQAEQADGLYAVGTPVHVVSQEEVAGIG